MEEIINIISTLGFPIAVCLLLFWYVNKIQDQHKEEINELKNVIENNTLVLQRLVDTIMRGDKDA